MFNDKIITLYSMFYATLQWDPRRDVSVRTLIGWLFVLFRYIYCNVHNDITHKIFHQCGCKRLPVVDFRYNIIVFHDDTTVTFIIYRGRTFNFRPNWSFGIFASNIYVYVYVYITIAKSVIYTQSSRPTARKLD